MRKLLIAVGSEILSGKIAEAVGGGWDVHTSGDGVTAARLIEQLGPDALILDMGLPGRDGIDILSALFPALPPVILAVGATVNPYAASQAARWGVDALFQIPFDIAALAHCLTAQAAGAGAKRTAQFLRALEICAGLAGHAYLVGAVPFYKEDPSRHMNKEVYAEVARVHRIDPRAVERGIRTAIRYGWQHGDPSLWQRYFRECPSNKEFIVTLSQLI